MRNYLLIVFCALLIAGCSGSGNSPVTPSGDLDGTPIIGLTDTGDSFNALGIMGVFELTVNPKTMDVTLVSKRSSAIGESYIVSGAGFWSGTPCADCLNVKSYSLTPGGALAIRFTSDHPFPAGNPAQPPSAKNRLDLDVFDLAAVIVPVTGATTPTTYTKMGVSAYTNVAINADGYTKELANVTGDNAAVPFFLVIDESGSATPTYNKYAMGVTGKEFDVELNIGGGAVPAFDIYLTMGYGASAKKATRLTPKYYNSEFNRKAAWKVAVVAPTTPWVDNDALTTQDVLVKVYDWQQGAVVSATIPYADETDTTKVFKASEVDSVAVEIPGMLAALATATIATSGTGKADDPLVYTFSIANENMLAAGHYVGLARVKDKRLPGTSSVGGEVDTLVHTDDGILLTWKSMPEFATYQTFPAEVIQGCGPISGRIVDPPLANYETITGLAHGQTLNITVNATSFGAGVTQYQADFDYDPGVGFVADKTQPTGVFTNLGPINVGSPCADNVPYAFDVAFRAKDNCTPANETIFVIYHGEATLCPYPTPVGNVTITVNRQNSWPWYPFDITNGPFTLSWSSPGSPPPAEYAIYVDTNPDDMALSKLTDNLTLAGTTTTTSWICPGSVMQTAKKHLRHTYVVRARSAVGVPASEAGNSELAFIETWGCETSTGWYQIDEEDWYSFAWNNSGGYYWYTWATYPISYNESYGFGIGSNVWSYYGNTWAGATTKLPTAITNSSRYVEACFYIYNYYYDGYYGYMQNYPGLFMFTTATQPRWDWQNPAAEWVQAYSSSPYQGYDGYYASTLTSQGWDGVGSDPTSWDYMWGQYYRGGADINATGNASDPYFGFCFDNAAVPGYLYWYGIGVGLDEIAVTIY